MSHRRVHVIVMVACLAAGTVGARLAFSEQDASGAALGPYTPPACTGIFTDVPCPGGFAVNWIEQFSREGITAGRSVSPPLFCPDTPVTRAQMAVFVEKALRGTSNWPPHTVLVWAVKNADGSPNPTASGQALLAGTASIPYPGNDTPSADNPWLIRVGPGLFDLGNSGASVPPFVSMEGAGEEATIITAIGYDPVPRATVDLFDGSALRFVTVRNTGAAAWTEAVSAWGRVSLTHVRAEATSISSTGSTIALGLIRDASTNVTATDCTFNASGALNNIGVDDTGVLSLNNVDIAASASLAGGTSTGIHQFNAGWGEIRNTRIYTYAASGESTGIDWNHGGFSVAGGWIHSFGPAGTALKIFYANCEMSDVELHAEPTGTAIYAYGSGSLEVNHCKVRGGYWIQNASGHSSLVGASLLAGSKTAGGTLLCAGNHDPSGVFWVNTCP